MQYPPDNQPYPQYPQQQPFTQPPMQPPPKKKPPKWAMGCAYVLMAAVVLAICAGVYDATIGRASSSSPMPTAVVQSQATTAPTKPPAPAWPPKTKADLQALASMGDASQIHAFHSESVGLTGVCPQPKTLATVSRSLKGKQLAEDLLAYFFGNHMDNPCGSVLFAFHSRAEGNGDNGYTAGRILLDTDNPSSDPNASNIKYTITLDTGDVINGQEYVVSYTK